MSTGPYRLGNTRDPFDPTIGPPLWKQQIASGTQLTPDLLAGVIEGAIRAGIRHERERLIQVLAGIDGEAAKKLEEGLRALDAAELLANGDRR